MRYINEVQNYKQVKQFTYILIILAFSNLSIAQTSWTSKQLENTNTAGHIKYLTKAEKEAIKYINLARRYPKQFLKIEFRNNKLNSKNVRSLKLLLSKMKPTHVLKFNNDLYKNAKCFAKESGEGGFTGHERKKCDVHYSGECCSYGVANGRGIALQWLIDENVPSLGHRKICLNPRYNYIGISKHAHKVWDICAVADFK